MQKRDFESQYDELREVQNGTPDDELIEAAHTVVEIYTSKSELEYREVRRLVDAGGIVLHEEYERRQTGKLVFKRLNEYADTGVDINAPLIEAQPSTWDELDKEADKFMKYFNATFPDETNKTNSYFQEFIGYAITGVDDGYEFGSKTRAK